MKIEILKPLDNFIDAQIEQLQEKPQFQEMLDGFSNLDDNIQKAIRVAISIIVVLIPFIILFLFSSMNSSLQDKLKEKEGLLLMAQKIISQQANINSVKNQYTGRSFVENQNQMSDLLSGTIGAAGVSSNNIKINNFSLIENDSPIAEARFELNFSALSNKQFFGMIRVISTTTNMRFSDISIQKNSSTNLLDGIMTTHYYSEMSGQEEEL
jgi:hypothetical protein